MSQLLSLPSLDLLLIAGRAVALVFGLLIFAWAFRHWRRAAMRDTQRVFEQLDLVRSELLIMKEVMHYSSHRGDAVTRAASYETRVETRTSSPVGSTARGYEIAARMARNGADKEELIRDCGVTGHEAELLVKLHGQRRDHAAALIGRQPRFAEALSTASAAGASAARQSQVNNQASQDAGRQAAKAPRQNTAAANTQRTPERASAPVNSGLARSRLVAVG